MVVEYVLDKVLYIKNIYSDYMISYIQEVIVLI